METAGLQRHSGTHSKAMNNDEANGCARSVHFANSVIQPTEYHLLYLCVAVQVGPQSVKKFCEYDAYIRFPELFLVKKDTITILTTRPSSIAEI